MNKSPGQRLRDKLLDEEVLLLPGAHDALTAKLIEAAGFEAVYSTGAGAAAVRGLPDIGLLTMTEMASNAESIARASRLPVLADADTGYGSAVNVMRTVEAFERAGVGGIHIEDQVFPKRCGHLEGKALIGESEMAGKIRAAVEARRDPAFVIVARVDARGPLGFEEAIRRGQSYIEAGADAIFPEALNNEEEFRAYAETVKAPLVANITEFGKSPLLSAKELAALGYCAVIFPISALRVALRAVAEFLDELKSGGTQAGALKRMATREELNQILEYERFDDAEARFNPQARSYLRPESEADTP
jgi:methylisocitrate lyase